MLATTSGRQAGFSRFALGDPEAARLKPGADTLLFSDSRSVLTFFKPLHIIFFVFNCKSSLAGTTLIFKCSSFFLLFVIWRGHTLAEVFFFSEGPWPVQF